MAFINRYGIKYDGSFDPILGFIRCIDLQSDTLTADVAEAHRRLDLRPCEEHGQGGYDITYAHLRLGGSRTEARRMLGAAQASSAPAAVVTLLERVVEEVGAAYDVVAARRAQTKVIGEDERPVQPWALVSSSPPEPAGPEIVTIELDARDF
jgi:hypothetical protein